MKHLVLLLLVGCAGISTTELEDQLFACDAAKAVGCDELRGELERRHKKADERAASRGNNCPRGMVELNDSLSGTRCISTHALNDAIGGVRVR